MDKASGALMSFLAPLVVLLDLVMSTVPMEVPL